MTQDTTSEHKTRARRFSGFALPAEEMIDVSSKRKKVIVIAGPTGVGKSSLAIEIAKEIGGEIISADSVQVYRKMDIGTAKVSKELRDEIPHHLIDIRDITESLNVVEYYREVSRIIPEIFARGKIPIIAGGTGFYIHAVLYGPPSGPPSEPELRDRLEEEMKNVGSLPLYERLTELDPEYARTITQNDRHKIIRALEIMTITDKKVSLFRKNTPEIVEDYNFRCWFLYIPREKLNYRLEKRCEEMIEQGLLEEVEQLKELGLEANPSASQAIGYRQGLNYLNSNKEEKDRELFIASFKQATRRYAKRQFTWFRKEPLFRWLDLDEITLTEAKEVIIQDLEISF